MAFQFKTHYTVDQARALLPQLREWLTELNQLRRRVGQIDKRLGPRLAAHEDLGGEMGNEWIKKLTGIHKLLVEIHKRENQIQDLERGPLEFSALLARRARFLC